MGFRNPIIDISNAQLPDVISGKLLRTGPPPDPRIEISEDIPGDPSIRFFSAVLESVRGRRFTGMDYGTFSGETDFSEGNVFVPHNLRAIPVAFGANITRFNPLAIARVVPENTDEFELCFQIRNSATHAALAPNVVVRLRWWAFPPS